MADVVRIGVIGDFEPSYHSYFATNAALYDAAAKLKVSLELRCVPTPPLVMKWFAENIVRPPRIQGSCEAQ